MKAAPDYLAVGAFLAGYLALAFIVVSAIVWLASWRDRRRRGGDG